MAQESELKTVIVTQDEPLYLPEFFGTFLERANRPDSPVEIAATVILDTQNGSHFEFAKKLFGVYGPTAFTRLGLQYARTRLAEQLHWAGLKRSAVTIPQLLNGADIDCWSFRDVNDPDFVSRLRFREIDVVAGVAPPQIFKPELLSAPTYGCINSHSGPLPRYRGMMPVFWSLLNDEPELTVTIHRMNENIDDGELLKQDSIPTSDGLSLDEAIRRTKRLSGRVMHEVLVEIADGHLDPIEIPDDAETSYFSFPEPKHGREFRRSGHSFF
mgnify:CR=1 FL=1